MKSTFLAGGWLAFVAPVLAVSAATEPATPALPSDAALTATVRAALAPVVAGILTSQSGDAPPLRVELLGAELIGEHLTLDFNRALLADGPGSLAFEQFSRRIHRAVADVLREGRARIEVETRIEGVPLPRFLGAEPATPPIARLQGPPPGAGVPPPQRALAGRRIALSPGHGYYLNGTRWVLQRDFYSGIVEDFVNHDLITLLDALLTADGADVRPTRNLDRAAGVGESGFARWQEAARYHVKALGADASVWNEPGFTHLEQDIRCRPLYANAVGAELLVSIHNNGGGGTGTETLYDSANAAAAGSRRLADAVHAAVVGAIRRDYNPAWADRRVQGFNGSYGENRIATRPAVIMEIAFMDRPSPDNAALRDERFKLLVATAVRDGIREFLDGPAAVPPIRPAALIATADATGIGLTWSDQSANETGFRIERRPAAGGAWSLLASVAAGTTSYRDLTPTAGAAAVYRVQSFNAAGDSGQFSNEATAQFAPQAAALTIADATPANPPVRDWEQETAFTLTVTDPAGLPVAGAVLVGQDGLRNAAIANLATDARGQADYRSIVPRGQADGTYRFEFQATKAGHTSSPVVARTLNVSHPASAASGAPTLLVQPGATTAIAGSRTSLRATARGDAPLAYQWHLDGTPQPGATDATLTLDPVTSAQAGRYHVVVTNRSGSVTSLEAPLTVAPAAWLANVSLRTTLGTGQGVIVGFVVKGGAKDLLVRAGGPALFGFGLTAAMTDPRLELFRGTAKVAENNDWPAALAPAIAALGAFPFAAASRDAALVQTVDGACTVQATGTAGGTVLIEGYDAGSGSAARLINLSARNRVGTGAEILIAGFYLAGNGTQRVLVRAVGPTLASLGVTGVLADPKLEVHDAGGRLAENDNWDAALAPVFTQVGAFPLPAGSRDAAVVLTLAAGRSYTAQVSGLSNTTGEALVEIYEVP